MQKSSFFRNGLIIMDFPAYHKSLEHLHVNCEKPRAYFIPYHSAEAAVKGERKASKLYTDLCGEWNFRFFNSFEDLSLEPFEYNEDFEPIDVPRSWQSYCSRLYDTPLYSNLEYPFPTDPPHVPDENPCGLYTKRFTLSDDCSNQELYINFEGVDSCFYLWLNDEFIGYSQVSHCSSEFRITDYAKLGENKLTVLVVKWCDGSYLEDQDCFRLSGIFREVYILSRPKAHISDVQITSDIILDASTAHVKVDLQTAGVPVKCGYTLFEPDGMQIKNDVSNDGKIEFTVCDARLWNDETPYLYTLVLQYENEFIPFKLALRRIEITNGCVLLNGKKVKARGINRHDSHPKLGHAVTMSDMLEDLYLLKRANCNTIRTSHYPNDPRFLELCDSLGFMVVDEADIETHGMGYEYDDVWDWQRWSLLSSSPEWKDAYVDRAARLYERDKNHGCVIMWSLGNESGAGVNHRAMAQYIRSRDSHAIIHYENSHLEFKAVPEGESFADISDVESRMYAGVNYIDRYFAEELSDKPFFLCEYVCSMSTGDVYAYWEQVLKYDGFFGGCIWEFCDHAVDFSENGENAEYLYGGDFKDFPNCGVCCVDGLVYPDRRPRPGYYDMKRVYQPFKADFTANSQLCIANHRYFKDLSDINVKYTLKQGKKVLASSYLYNVDVPAQCCKVFDLFECKLFDFTGSAMLTLSFFQAEKEEWADVGYEIGFEQFELIKDADEKLTVLPIDDARIVKKDDLLPNYTPTATGKVNVSENQRKIILSAANTVVTFDRAYGRVEQIEIGGSPLLKSPIAFSIWHAPTYNVGSSRRWISERFNRIVQKTYSSEVIAGDGTARIKFKISLGGPSTPPVIHADVVWTLDSNGVLSVDVDSQVRENAPLLPRFGLTFELREGFESMEYFGFGPLESYADRYLSQQLDLHKTTVTDNFEHYIKPQENSSHFATRYASLTNEDGLTLRFSPLIQKSFSFNAQHYSAEQLTCTAHDFDLYEHPTTFVYLDYAVNAISENAEIEQRRKGLHALLDEKHIKFGFVISHVVAD